MSEQVASWSIAPLGNLVDVLDSKRVPINSSERSARIAGRAAGDLVPYYGATGQVGWIDESLFDEELLLLGEDGVPFHDLLKKKAYRIRGRSWVNNHAHVLRAKSYLLDARYLEHFLNQYDYVGTVTGSTRLKLTQAAMVNIPVPLAPYLEQQRIADKLDTVLARVDACRERLANVAPLIERFRQSVLAAAVSGDLSKEWRAAQGIGDGKFAMVPITSVSSARLGKMLDKQKNVGNQVPYLGNINVRWFEFDLSDLKQISIQDHERDALSLRDGDVLICEGGEPGRCAVWRSDSTPIIFQKALHRVRPDQSRLLPDWLAFCMQHLCVSGGLDDLFTGTTIKHLTGVALSRISLPLPELDEQIEIVRRVRTLFAFANRLGARLAQAQEATDRLTPALLAKAFRGELLPQDPSDEPAADLLRRLAESQPSMAKSTGKRSRAASR